MPGSPGSTCPGPGETSRTREIIPKFCKICTIRLIANHVDLARSKVRMPDEGPATVLLPKPNGGNPFPGLQDSGAACPNNLRPMIAVEQTAPGPRRLQPSSGDRHRSESRSREPRLHQGRCQETVPGTFSLLRERERPRLRILPGQTDQPPRRGYCRNGDRRQTRGRPSAAPSNNARSGGMTPRYRTRR
jgi:hypothetical protein